MTISQFAQSVKAKYPEYKDVPDDQLTQQIIQKYPQYKDQILPATQADPTTFGSALPNGGTSIPGQKSKTGNGVYDALKGNPISNFLLGQAGNVAQDIGTGMRGIMEKGNLNKNEQMAQQLEAQAQQAKDPNQKKSLLQQANQIRTSISNEAGSIGQSFSPDVNQNPISRGVGAAGQIATTAEIPGMVASIPKVVGGVLHPIQTLGALRSKVIGDASVPTEDATSGIMNNLTNSSFYQQAQAPTKQAADSQVIKFLSDLNPATTVGQNEATQIAQPATTGLNQIYKNLTPYETMAKAYSKGSDLPSTAVSQGANLTSRAAREYLKSASPKAANAITDLMHLGYLSGKYAPALAKWIGIPAALLEGTNIAKNIFSGKSQ